MVFAVTILMVIEARRVGVKFVWAYIIGAFVIAISVAFPLFLLARELRLEKSDATLLRPVDTILLVLARHSYAGHHHLGGSAVAP